MMLALEHQNPLTTGAVLGGKEGSYPEFTYSLLTVDHPAVLLWALKPAEEGIERGIVARLWNLSASSVQARLTYLPGLESARRTTHVETDLEPMTLGAAGAVPIGFAPEQLQTYRLMPKPALPE